jgi:hypothetical protein
MRHREREGPFEILLREFMAGRMSSKAGNTRIRKGLKRAWIVGRSSSILEHMGPVKERWTLKRSKEIFEEIFGFRP